MLAAVAQSSLTEQLTWLSVLFLIMSAKKSLELIVITDIIIVIVLCEGNCEPHYWPIMCNVAPQGDKNTQMYWINNESWARPLEFMQCSAGLWDQVMKPISLTLFQMKHVMTCSAIIAFLAAGEVNTRMSRVCFCQLHVGADVYVCDSQGLATGQQLLALPPDCFAFFSSSSMERSAQKAHTMRCLQRGRKARCCALFETETVEKAFAIWNNPFKVISGWRFCEANNVRWGRPDGMRRVEAQHMISPQICQF